jgi:hypothetical protein
MNPASMLMGVRSIAGVAPGIHRITLWHETLGVMVKEVQVPAHGTVVVAWNINRVMR